MASYQIDFQNGEIANDAQATYALITRYKASTTFRQAVEGWNYFMGENTTIAQLRRYYWKDGVKDEKTGKRSSGGFVVNDYVANNKIGYSFFTDMVTQKVDTLFREIPTISSEVEIPTNFYKQFGYGMRTAAERCSAQAISYILIDNNNNLNVFAADRCIPFYDDNTGELKALIRWWIINGMKSLAKMYWEVYTDDGVITYCNRPRIEMVKPLEPYKYKIKQSALSTDFEPIKSELPIVEFINNEYRTSDLSGNIRSKIDIIDIVQSGFANNIEDFSDAFWVIKDGLGMSNEYMQDMAANIARTKMIIGDGADMKQFQIPTEARSKFVEMMKEDLIRDGGVVDTKALTQGNLTATAIRAARANLETRVSKFEWQAYNAATKVLEIYFNRMGWQPEFDVTFNKYALNNETEAIQNATMIRGTVSERTYLKMLQGAGVIDDVDKEIEEMQNESQQKYGSPGGGIID